MGIDSFRVLGVERGLENFRRVWWGRKEKKLGMKGVLEGLKIEGD